MNKWLGGVIVLMFIWVAKLSWDIHQLNTLQLHHINMQIDQQSQRVGRLNDEFVALQNNLKTAVSIPSATISEGNTSQDPQILYVARDYFADRIQLAQLAIDQQQFNLALEYIQELRQQLAEDQTISEALKDALLLALVRDQSNIVSYLQQRSEHLQLIQQQLSQLNRSLVPQSLDADDNKWDLSHWFSLEKASDTPHLLQRDIYYQKLQLKVMLAQQALLSGQVDFYRQQLAEVLILVDLQPDDKAKKIAQQVRKLQQMNLTRLPQMSAIALMRDA